MIVVLLSGFGIAVVHLLFVTSVTGRRVDGAALHGADEFGGGPLWATAAHLLDIVSVPFVAGVVIVTMALAFARRRVALAVQVAVLVAGANVTTQVLKSVLVRPDLGLADRIANSLPSGHTTVAASAAAALVLAVPAAVPRRCRGGRCPVHDGHRRCDADRRLASPVRRGRGDPRRARVGRGRSSRWVARARGSAAQARCGGLRPFSWVSGLVLAGLSGVAYIDVSDRSTWDHTGYLMAAGGGSLAIAAFAFAAFGVLVGMVAAADPADG